MQIMYAGVANSPGAVLNNDVNAAATIIPVSDVSAFPVAPNRATIGTDENAETIIYAAKTDTALSGCTRGVEGTAAAWATGTPIARYFTNGDYAALVSNVTEVASYAADHAADTTNPHSVTKAQVGLANVDNTSDADKPISTAAAAAFAGKASAADLTTHTRSTTNPHSVTKTQVELGNVDNTSDADKPISTAAAAALAGKASAASLTAHTGNGNVHVTTGDKAAWNGKAPLASPAFTGVPTAPTAAMGTNSTQVATTAFVNTALTAAIGTAIGGGY